MNSIQIQATVADIQPVRYTPAGVPVLELVLEHQSEVMEAGLTRRLQFSIDSVAIGDTALQLANIPLQAVLVIQGFIAPRHRSSVRMVLHIQQAKVQYPGSGAVVV